MSNASVLKRIADIHEVGMEKLDDYDERTDLLRVENLAISLSYLSVGIVSAFIVNPLNVYMIEVLHAEPTVQSTITILRGLPWSMKLFFGFLSDSCPIAGLHRKPYTTMGSLLFSMAYLTYGLSGVHDVSLLAICTFIGTIGLIMIDVMADAMCVQRSKFQPIHMQGQLQATCYSIRFGGFLIGAILGSTVYQSDAKGLGWGLDFFQICCVIGIIPALVVVPWLTSLVERYSPSDGLSPQARSRRSQQGVSSTSDVPPTEETPSSVPLPTNLHQTLNMGKIGSGSGNRQSCSAMAEVEDPVEAGISSSTLIETRKGKWVQQPERTLIEASDPELLPLLPKKKQQQQQEEQQGQGHELEGTLETKFSVQENISFRGGKRDLHPSMQEQARQIWNTAQLRSVWRPMIFVYSFNILQVSNVSWQSYLLITLQFSPWILGSMLVVGAAMSFAGVLAYKTFFFSTSWRSIYVYTCVLVKLFTVLQLLLIFQINTRYLHLNDVMFSLGDDVVTAYVSGIRFLPVNIMYMRLCPDGAEGATYALLTTFGNIAGICAGDIGNVLAGIWDVSNEALQRGDVSGMWKLTLLTAGVGLVPLTWLHLLPRNTAEQSQLAGSSSRSPFAGAVFLLTLAASIVWSLLSAVAKLSE